MCVCVCPYVLLYLSKVEEGHRVARVGVVGPAFLSGVVELHIPDLSFTLRKKVSITGFNKLNKMPNIFADIYKC